MPRGTRDERLTRMGSRRRMGAWAAGGALGGMLLALVSVGSAQVPFEGQEGQGTAGSKQYVVLRDQIEFIGQRFIVVSGVTALVDEGTIIVLEGGRPGRLQNLRVNDEVQVTLEFPVLGDRGHRAVAILQGRTFRIRGRISGVQGHTIIVAGFEIDLTPNTKIRSLNDDLTATPDPDVIGTPVLVFGQTGPGRRLVGLLVLHSPKPSPTVRDLPRGRGRGGEDVGDDDFSGPGRVPAVPQVSPSPSPSR